MSAGRKSPVLLMKWKRPVDARQAIWEEIRRNAKVCDGANPFTAAGISLTLKIHRDTVDTYLDCLLIGGYVAVDQGQYSLTRDVGRQAPRLRADGSVVEMGKGRTAAWRGMRIMKRFTTRELHNATGAAETDIRSFCTYLLKAGYLKKISGGRSGNPATYQLIRNTGPEAPQVTRAKFVFDPNLTEVTWPTAVTEIEAVVEGAP
jgi:hypothetical protein